MDFIFDQFVELETEAGLKFYVSMYAITCVKPTAVDQCDVYCAGYGNIFNVKTPARVLIQKIAQRRQEGQKMLSRCGIMLKS